MTRPTAAALLCATLLLAGCGDSKEADATASAPASTPASPVQTTPDATAAPEPTPTGPMMIETESGLKIEIGERGTGATPTAGQTVHVHYTGKLEDGTKFDSSHDHPGARPISFELGRKQVIAGWEEGLLHLPVGSKARLTIPSDLAYGERGFSNVIPPNATLIFDVELVKAD